jgi:hypothetical protein
VSNLINRLSTTFGHTQIVATFSQLNMLENWTNYIPPFNPQALTLLGVCERAFQRLMTAKYKSAGPLLDEEVLKDLLADIGEASDSVIQADIEPEAKQLLLEIL